MQPAEPAEPALPPPDDDGLSYQADLLTLAGEQDLPTTPRSDPAQAAEPVSGDARTRHHTADPAPAAADVEETR